MTLTMDQWRQLLKSTEPPALPELPAPDPDNYYIVDSAESLAEVLADMERRQTQKQIPQAKPDRRIQNH